MIRNLSGEIWPWLAGAVVWTAGVGAVAGSTAPRGYQFDWLESLGWFLVAVVGTANVVKAVWPVRVVGNPPARIVNRRWAWELHTFTGVVLRHQKLSSTTTFRNVTTFENRGSYTHVQDDFTLADAELREKNVQVGGLNLSLAVGQVVSVVWAIRAGQTTGQYLMVRNHSDGGGWVRFTGFTDGVAAASRNRGSWHEYARIFGFNAWGGLMLGLAGHTWGFVVMVALPVLLSAIRRRRGGRLRKLLERAVIPSLDARAAELSRLRSVGQELLERDGAGWHPDPTGAHDHRYWNGTRWTDHVADAGVQSLDPI
jgi:hypothetical protein